MSDERIVELLAAALREPPVEFITDDESWEYVMARAGLAALRAEGFEVYRPDRLVPVGGDSE